MISNLPAFDETAALPFIWRPDGPAVPPNTWTYFKTLFDLQETAATTVWFAADPTARLWINGKLVLARVMRHVSPWITVEEIDLAPFLRPGRNVAVILHHWWGVATFQRSPGSAPGVAVLGDCLQTSSDWRWQNAEEFWPHPHQTIGGNAQRIRFPVVLDAQLENAALHQDNFATGIWEPAVLKSSPHWAKPVRKETPALEREEKLPKKIEAAGTVTPPNPREAPFGAASISWLAKNSSYDLDSQRISAMDFGNADNAPSILNPGTDGYCTLDFGLPLHGYLRIKITAAAAGTILDLTHGELRWNLHAEKPVLLVDGSFDPELILGGPCGDRVVLRDGAQEIEIPEERTCRWLMITWRNASAPVEIARISLMTSQYPAVTSGTFAGGPPEVAPLIGLCLDHARVTMSDVYVDTPGREDGQWLEDIQYRAQLSAQWFGDVSLRQVTLRHAAEQQTPNGRFRVFPPEDYGEEGLQLLDWGMVWIGMLYDDWLWTGEIARVKAYFSNLIRFLEVAYRQTNFEGMLVDRTCLADLRLSTRANFDKGECESISNAWYYGFLTNAIRLAKAAGEVTWEQRWQARADAVREGFPRFLRREEGKPLMVAEVWSPQGEWKGIGQAAAASAAFYGVLSPELTREVLANAFDDHDGSPPKDCHRWNNPTYAYRTLRSLSDHGLGKRAGRHFLERYTPYLPDGPLPEYFVPGSAQPPDPTGSHGWAAVPLVWFHDTILGVRLQQAGGEFLFWRPINVGWSQVGGTTVTPLGSCEVEIDWKKGAFSIHLPQGAEAEVWLPVVPNRLPSLPPTRVDEKHWIWQNVNGDFAIHLQPSAIP